jgi:nucleoside-diphosphate-sugar epimerase
MRILVTGGTGFTGTHLTRRLLAEGHQVVVLDNQPGLFFRELQARGAVMLLGSVADRVVVDEATQSAEIIFHAAAAFRKVNLPRAAYWTTNVGGTRCLIEAALRHGARKFIYISTCGVHGHVAQGRADEDALIAPEDYYQYSKYQGERAVVEAVERGLPAVILRPAAIYGPGDPERFLMLFKRVRTGRFPMFGTGRVHYHPLFIDNLVDACLLAADSDRRRGEAFLIADDHSYSLKELVGTIADVLRVPLTIRHYPFWPLWLAALACELLYRPLPMEPPLFRRRVDWFRQHRSFDIRRAKLELGYQPKVGLKDGLMRTAQWYRAQGYL